MFHNHIMFFFFLQLAELIIFGSDLAQFY